MSERCNRPSDLNGIPRRLIPISRNSDDHRAEIDRELEKDEAFLQAFRRNNPSPLKKHLKAKRLFLWAAKHCHVPSQMHFLCFGRVVEVLKEGPSGWDYLPMFSVLCLGSVGKV